MKNYYFVKVQSNFRILRKSEKVSSAHDFVFTEFVIVFKPFIIEMNSSGPRTDPCWTP